MSVAIELGQCGTSRNGLKYVWAHIDPCMTLTHVNVGTVSDLLQASGELTRTLCEESYPGLWRLVEEKIIENMELDDGI